MYEIKEDKSDCHYVEDEILHLPFLTDGEMKLGDLWDCTESKKISDTLFKTELTLKYLESPREINKDEKLIELCKSTSEILKVIDVHGEMKLELPLGLLTVRGSAYYKEEQKNNELSEKLIYNYVYKTYQIRIDKLAKELIDKNVIDKINKKVIKATHFVYGITLGAEINAEITVSQSEKVNKKDVEGNAFLDLSMKKVKLAGEAFLNWIDHGNNEQLNNKVKIQSAPAHGAKEETIKTVLEEVGKINDKIEKTNFLEERKDIKGVVIRYELWPIKSFVYEKFHVEIERMYRKLESHELKEIEDKLMRMCDIRSPNYVTKRLIKEYQNIITILYDQNAELTKAVIKYEDEIRREALEFLREASEMLQKYKQNLANIGEMLEIVKKYDSNCKSNDVDQQIKGFADFGKKELSFVTKLENLDLRKYITIITSEESLREFKNDKEDVKIWLHNNEIILEDVYQCLYEIIEKLNEKGIKLGFAVRSISKNPEFCIDIKGKTVSYEEPHVFPYIFGIISSALRIGNENKKLFHCIHAKMLNVEQPLENMCELNDFIKGMMYFKDVIINETYLITSISIKDKDNKWKFFIPINAEQSSSKAIEKMAQIFNHDTPTNKYLRDPKNIDWIVGSINVTQKINETAFLFIIKNGRVMATCLDELDMNLISEMFLDRNEELLTLLDPKKMIYSFYPERAKSAETIIQSIELENPEKLDIKIYGLQSFEKIEDENDSASTVLKFQKLHQGLKNLSKSVDRTRGVVDFLHMLTNREIFNESNWEEIWKNNRFDFIIKSVDNDSRILEGLYKMGCESSVPHYIPSPIALKIRSRFFSEDVLQNVNNFDEFKVNLETIAIKREVPKNFRAGLYNSIKNNIELFEKLGQLDILEEMHYDGKAFPDEIGIETIDKIRKIISEFEFKKPDSQDLQHLYISFKKEPSKTSKRKHDNKIKINSILNQLVGDSMEKLRYKEYILLKQIMKESKLSSISPQSCKEYVLPFLMQKIKMWGCYSLSPYEISELVKTETLEEKITDPFSEENDEVNEQSEQKSQVELPFSRIDIIVAILNSVDALVAQEILNNMSKFLLAMPLVMRDLTEEKSYKVLIPWLTQPIIKWGIDKENIIENHLFVDKFKLIVCLRLGNATLGNNGKSTLLNAILKEKNIFSCCGEPRAIKGKPLTLDGTVEFIFLTKETVGKELWNSLSKEYYMNDKEYHEKDLLLLANLHGDALDHREILLFLESITTSYIVFMMPDVGELDYDEFHDLKNKELKNILNSKNISYLVIDPPTGSKHNKLKDIILNSSKTDDNINLEKLRKVLIKSSKFTSKVIHSNYLNPKGCVKMAEKIETEQSNKFIEFAKIITWSTTKNSLFLQKQIENNDKLFNTPEIKKTQNEIISMMRNILLLDRESRLIAMTHLDKELSRISSLKTKVARKNYIKYHKDYEIDRSDETLEKRNQYLNEMDENNFGLEHIFREIGRAFEFFTSETKDNKLNPYWDAPKLYAELLIDGHALELLDGDSCSITGSWLSAIFEHVNELKPGLRVFVISILGLQSSGKSTLLNALFACKFAVSVGRCTKGLFMRLLFLDEKIKNDLENKFDTILLIDSEGLEALEKINEKDAGRKDRALATLAIGISHLTIVNVKGENMNSLTDIMQIALIAMTRLEIADISPDILTVQHLDTTDDASLATARMSFNDALQKATELLKDKYSELGVINSACLEKLKQTIKSNEYFTSFPPFKNGPDINSAPSEGYHMEIVKLFRNILNIAKNSNRKTDFVQWPIVVKKFWDSVKNEDFLSFKGLEVISEFFKINGLISEAKKSTALAYDKHQDKLLEKYHEENKSNVKLTSDEIAKDFDDELLKCPANEEQCPKCKKFKNDRDFLYKEVKDNPKTINDINSYIAKTRKFMVYSIEMKLEAEKTRECESEDVLKTINKLLKKALDNKKAGSYKEEEIKKLTDYICNCIRNEKAEKNPVENINIRIIKAIRALYPQNPKFTEDHQKNPITSLKEYEQNFFIIYVKSFFKIRTNSMERNLIEQLQTKIDGIIKEIFKENESKNFQPSMIETVKKGIEEIIIEFEKTVGKMNEKFKLILHSFAYYSFEKDMKTKQLEWDKQFNPYRIFCDMEQKYKDLIKNRLILGFGLDNEGTMAGYCLLEAIKNYALNEANDYKIESIKKIGWLTGSSTIRLKYFLDLVKQVEKDNFQEALQHFSDPKKFIDEWFIDNLDKLPVKGVMDKFNTLFKSECKKVIEKIELASSLSGIREAIKLYANKNKAVYYLADPEDKKETDDMNLDHYKTRIIKVINKCKEIDFNESDISFITPSKDSTLLKIMGCTASCPICGALCWNDRDHDKDTGDSRFHHTSHQPMGLSRVRYKDSKQLLVESCHHQKSDDIWWHNDERMTWSQFIARDEYNNWTYGIHRMKEFDDMMKWFFYKLYKDIKQKYSLELPKSEELEDYIKPNSLNIKDIKATINLTIGKIMEKSNENQ